MRIPVAHGDGRYVADAETLARLEAEGQVVLRYAEASPGTEGNPNMSSNDIAGICNAAGTVVGIMPHPERVADPEARLGRRSRLFMRSLAGVRALAGVGK